MKSLQSNLDCVSYFQSPTPNCKIKRSSHSVREDNSTGFRLFHDFIEKIWQASKIQFSQCMGHQSATFSLWVCDWLSSKTDNCRQIDWKRFRWQNWWYCFLSSGKCYEIKTWGRLHELCTVTSDLPTPKAQNECDQLQNEWENECKGYI